MIGVPVLHGLHQLQLRPTQRINATDRRHVVVKSDHQLTGRVIVNAPQGRNYGWRTSVEKASRQSYQVVANAQRRLAGAQDDLTNGKVTIQRKEVLHFQPSVVRGR